MDKWTTLEPVKLYGGGEIPKTKTGPSKANAALAYAHQNRAQFIGRIPSEIHLLILQFVAVPDIPSYARANRALSRLSGDDRLWQKRYSTLIGSDNSVEGRVKSEEKMRFVLEELEKRGAGRENTRMSSIRIEHVRTPNGSISMDLGAVGSPIGSAVSPKSGQGAVQYAARPVVAVGDDDFGDFATADLAADEFDDFVGAIPSPPVQKVSAFPSLLTPPFHAPPLVQQVPTTIAVPSMYSSAYRTRFKQAYIALRPLLRYIHPSTPPHSLLSILLPTPQPPPQPTSPNPKIGPPTLQVQSQLLSVMNRFLSSFFKPIADWELRSHALRSAVDAFESNLLKSFEDGDEGKDNRVMREAAFASWELYTCWGIPSRSEIIGQALEVGNGLYGGLGKLVGIGRKRAAWEVGKVWIERREEFYEQGKWDPLANFTYIPSFLPFPFNADS